MEARIWFRPEMAGDETALWISCGVALHTSCWNLIVPVSCWNSVASDSPIWTSVYFRVVAETVESSRTKIHRSLYTAVEVREELLHCEDILTAVHSPWRDLFV